MEALDCKNVMKNAHTGLNYVMNAKQTLYAKHLECGII